MHPSNVKLIHHHVTTRCLSIPFPRIIIMVTCLSVIHLSSLCQSIKASPSSPSSNYLSDSHGSTRSSSFQSTFSSPSSPSPSSSSPVHKPSSRREPSHSIIDRSIPQHQPHQPTKMSDLSILKVYDTPNVTINFTHIAYDHRFDRLYVGASNWLYQFNSSLGIEVSIKTGPVDDSPHCSASDCSGVDINLMVTTNFNKILVIDENSNKLIVCGSVHQGACRRHDLNDISSKEKLIGLPVAANDENSSTYAFIGPAKYSGSPAKSVLYVGITNTRLGSYRDIVPAISSRSLDPDDRLFNIIETSFTDTSLVDIESHLKDYYLVKYVYGFHTEDFVYFATVQKKSHLRALEEWGYVTRLARICSSDAAYNTYTEVTLTCLGPDGTDYTLLQDAVTTKAGKALAADLNVKPGSQLFIGVFSTAKDHTWEPSHSSAICVYPLPEIETKFNENIHLCYNGSALTRNMDYIAGNIKDCPEPGSANVASFCGETLKLNGSIPIVSNSVIVYNETLTAITVLPSDRNNIALVGTSKGRLKKIVLSHPNHAEEVAEINIDPGHPILPDLFIRSNQRELFVASPYRLAKVSLDGYTDFVEDARSIQDYVRLDTSHSASYPSTPAPPSPPKPSPRTPSAPRVITPSRSLPTPNRSPPLRNSPTIPRNLSSVNVISSTSVLTLPETQRESNDSSKGGNGTPIMSDIANAITIVIGLGAIVIVLLIVFVYSRSKGTTKTSLEFCENYQTGNLAYDPATTTRSHLHHPIFGSSSPDYSDPYSERAMSLMHGSLGVTTINQLNSSYSKILINETPDKRNSSYLYSHHIYDYPQ